MNYCPKCGDKLYEGSEFCMNCGFKLPTKQEQSPETHEDPEQSELAPVENTSTESIQVITKKRNKKRILLVSLISVFVIMLAVGAVWFFFLRATGTNFLNIKWGESATNVESSILTEIENSGVKHSGKSNGKYWTFFVEEDIFFGLEANGSEFIMPNYSSGKLNKISVLISSDYDAETTRDEITRHLNKQFGSPDKIETIGGEGSGLPVALTFYKAVWNLKETNIEVSISPGILSDDCTGTITFEPIE